MKIQNQLIRYTPHEKENFLGGRIIIPENDNDIESFVKDSISKFSNSKLYFGKVNQYFTSKIKNHLGIDVRNYNISLSADAVKHIFSHHGNKLTENNRGQIQMCINDFKKIPNIILDYDTIHDINETIQNQIAIVFKKEIGITYYIVIYISNKSHSLEIKTMYKVKHKKELCPCV